MMKTPSNKHIITSAPGSIMLTGEHAVVYGYNAIVCAVAQRVTVRLSRRDDDAVVIDSALSQYRAPRNALSDDVKLRFVLAAIKQAPLTCGISIHIDSAIDPTLGLGSSAAVTVATLYALAQLQQHNSDKAHIHQQALNIIRTIQGRGSGVDIAASVYGGMLAYRLNPFTLNGCHCHHRLVYAIAVIKPQRRKFWHKLPHAWQAIHHTIKASIKPWG